MQRPSDRFWAAVKVALRERETTLHELALKMGVGRAGLYYGAKRRADLGLNLAAALAAELGIEPEKFFPKSGRRR